MPWLYDVLGAFRSWETRSLEIKERKKQINKKNKPGFYGESGFS